MMLYVDDVDRFQGPDSIRSAYPQNRRSYISKTASLYWISPQDKLISVYIFQASDFDGNYYYFYFYKYIDLLSYALIWNQVRFATFIGCMHIITSEIIFITGNLFTKHDVLWIVVYLVDSIIFIRIANFYKKNVDKIQPFKFA